MKGFRLARCSRLRGVKQCGDLFERGASCGDKLVRGTFLLDVEHQRVLVSAPKRTFGRAVDRNLIKRRLREAYRLNRWILGDMRVHLALRYVGRQIRSYEQIEDGVRKVLESLASAGQIAKDAAARGASCTDNDSNGRD